MSMLRRGRAPSPKLTRPVPPVGALPREQLARQMLAAPAGVWIGSPAASGKTVLAALALQHGGRPACWYQVDHGDADPGSFFHFLGLAAQAVAPQPRALKAGKALPAYGREVGAQLTDFARAWCRALFAQAPADLVLVLDDWHWIDERSPLQGVLSVLLDELPAGAALWVLSRHAPPPTLDTAQLRGRLLPFGFDQLALTRDEVRALVESATPASPALRPNAAADERAERWHRWCEGWVGALVFALAAGRHEPANLPAAARAAPLGTPSSALPSEPASTVFGFLAAELFDHLDAPLQHVMLVTAWLPFVDGDLARQALPDADINAAIAALARRGLLLAGSGEQRPSWRYHRLLREFLRARARSLWRAEQLAAVLVGHARALERSQRPEAAADLWRQAAAVDARAWPELAALLLREAPRLLQSGRYATLEDWAEALPEAERGPWVDFWWAQALLARDARLGYRQFEQAFAGFWREGDAQGLYRSWCGVIEGITYACDDYGALELWLTRLRELRQRFPRYPSLLVRAQVSVYGFSATFFLRPQAPEFAAWRRNVQRLYRLALRRADRVAIGGLIGLYHASVTGMDALGAHLRSLRPLLDDDSVPPFHRLVGGLSDVIHHWIAGSTDDALARLAAYAHLATHTGAHAIDRQFAFHHVYVHCLRGELALAAQHLQSLAPALAQLGQIDVAQYHFLCGWLAALEGRHGEAVHLLEEAYTNARVRRFALFEAVSRGLLAELLASTGDFLAARRHADGALAVAQQMGSVTAIVPCHMQRAAVAELAGDDSAAVAGLIATAFGQARQHGHWAWGGLYPPTLARLAWRALALGVEVDFARELVRRRGLLPPPAAAHSPAWPWRLTLRAFGPLSVRRDDAPLAAGQGAAQRPLDLLRALLCVAPAPLPVSTALDWLWPDTTGADQRKVFDVALHRLRKLLGDDSLLRLDGGKLSLDPQRVWSDVGALAAQLGLGGDAPGSAAAAAAPLPGWARGSFLDGDDAPWIRVARELWRRRLALALAMPARAAADVQPWFDADPASEPMARRLIELHVQRGEHAQARGVLQLCAQARELAGERPVSADTQNRAQRPAPQNEG
jgi:LuxR family transcriptional regulator, maltose regulon positive regulatory protein